MTGGRRRRRRRLWRRQARYWSAAVRERAAVASSAQPNSVGALVLLRPRPHPHQASPYTTSISPLWTEQPLLPSFLTRASSMVGQSQNAESWVGGRSAAQRSWARAHTWFSPHQGSPSVLESLEANSARSQNWILLNFLLTQIASVSERWMRVSHGDAKLKRGGKLHSKLKFEPYTWLQNIDSCFSTHIWHFSERYLLNILVFSIKD